jgi:hypothetical protein
MMFQRLKYSKWTSVSNKLSVWWQWLIAALIFAVGLSFISAGRITTVVFDVHTRLLEQQ